MPKKGTTNNPNGRPKGVANKATTQAREAIAAFVEGNIERLNMWLDQIAAESPKDAFNCFMDVVEYHIPKLQRTEMHGEVKHNYVMRSPEISPSVEQWQENHPEVTIQ